MRYTYIKEYDNGFALREYVSCLIELKIHISLLLLYMMHHSTRAHSTSKTATFFQWQIIYLIILPKPLGNSSNSKN